MSDKVKSIPKIHKTIKRQLSTGQKITLTLQEEKMLKCVYLFMAGYAQRKILGSQIEYKKRAIFELSDKMTAAARLLLLRHTRDTFRSKSSPSESSPSDDASYSQDSSKNFGNAETDQNVVAAEQKAEEYYTMKDELAVLEDQLKRSIESDQKITFKDVDSLLKWLGSTLSKKQIEQMIWEVDEKNDEVVCYDEFCLTYIRNVNCTPESTDHPSSFFHLMDFILYDQSGSYPKGYIMEDDCMEILYARHGGQNLEKEMKQLFGGKLKASGGDGALKFHEFLSSKLQRIGKRAIIT